MIYIWNTSPIIRAVLPFMAGIAVMVNLQTHVPWAAAIALGLLIIAWALMQQKPNRSIEIGKGIVLTFAFFFLGLFITSQKTERFQPDHLIHQLTDSSQLIVRIYEPPTQKARSWKVPVKTEQVIEHDSSKSVFGKAYIYLEPDSMAPTLRYGDRLLLHQPPDTLEPPSNPAEFNYKRYLSFHNIYHQGYHPSGTYEIIGRNKGHPVFAFIYKLRRHLLHLIDSYMEDPQSQSVAGALLLGYRDRLDKELLTAYASTGAMHVLAVSGLHVGIIFLVLKELTQFLKRRKWARRYLQPALLLGGIWFFATITGLSPSVSRAATMFSFVIIGQSLDRPVNIYSSLAASAFLLLAINPYILTEIGFLLSYAAVLGIVYFQPKFYRLLYVKNWLLDKAWAITCVSLAAQLATFPIGILFFYQFPAYFFISNLVVIPAAMVILYMGITMFVFSWVPPLSMALGWLLNWSIYGLNWCIHQIEQLPGALIQPLALTIPQTILIYVLIIGLSVFLVRQQIKGLLVGIAATTLLIASLGWMHLQQSSKDEAVVYAVNGHSAYAFIDGRKGYFLADSGLLADRDRLLFHVLHHWWQTGIRPERLPLANNNAGYQQFSWNNLTVIRPLKVVSSEQPPQKAEADLILVSENCEWTPDEVHAHWKPKTVILDGSCRYRLRQTWKEVADKYGWQLHDVNEQGAWLSGLP